MKRMLELHHYPPSTTSIKVRLCLHEKGLEFAERILDLSRFDHLSPEFLALNPAGQVPVLIIDGRVLTESRIIDEYLEERFPDPPLMPADPLDRARVRLWSHYIDRVPTVAVQAPTFVTFLAPSLATLPREEVDRQIERIPTPTTRALWRRMVDGAIDSTELEASFATMESVLDRLEAALDDGPWLVGSRYTLADLELTPSIVRLEHLGRSDLWRQRSRVAAWVERVKERPSFARAYAFTTSTSTSAVTEEPPSRTEDLHQPGTGEDR